MKCKALANHNVNPAVRPVTVLAVQGPRPSVPQVTPQC